MHLYRTNKPSKIPIPLIDIKTGTITEKELIVIPRSVRNIFQPGEKVAILAYKDRIEISPLSTVQEALSSAYASENILKKCRKSAEQDDAWKDSRGQYSYRPAL
jgi:hypothetical protein